MTNRTGRTKVLQLQLQYTHSEPPVRGDHKRGQRAVCGGVHPKGHL